MEKSDNGRWLFSAGLVVLAVFFDQITKYLVLQGWSFDLGFIQSTLVFNTGTLWSLFAGPSVNSIFIILSCIILSGVVWVSAKYPEYRLHLAVVFAGGLGNLVDRIIHGAVVDFIHIGWWPIFNVADTLLSIGVILILIRILREE